VQHDRERDQQVAETDQDDMSAPPSTPAATTPPPPRATPVQPILAAQRRARRFRFLAGLALIVVPGALWAGLTKDPVRQQNFNQFGGDVFVGGARPVRAEPARVVNSEEIELASGEEMTFTRDLFETNLWLLELDAGDQLVVTVSADDNEFPPGFRSIIDLNLAGPDGGTGAAIVIPAEDETSTIALTAETAGQYTVELMGDFSPFSVELTVARNPDDVDEADAPIDPDGEG